MYDGSTTVSDLGLQVIQHNSSNQNITNFSSVIETIILMKTNSISWHDTNKTEFNEKSIRFF